METQNTGNGFITVQIPCALKNPSLLKPSLHYLKIGNQDLFDSLTIDTNGSSGFEIKGPMHLLTTRLGELKNLFSNRNWSVSEVTKAGESQPN